ncbi:MAG: flagellar hook-length control protein FliK [Panacagrimonas sp.]
MELNVKSLPAPSSQGKACADVGKGLPPYVGRQSFAAVPACTRTGTSSAADAASFALNLARLIVGNAEPMKAAANPIENSSTDALLPEDECAETLASEPGTSVWLPLGWLPMPQAAAVERPTLPGTATATVESSASCPATAPEPRSDETLQDEPLAMRAKIVAPKDRPVAQLVSESTTAAVVGAVTETPVAAPGKLAELPPAAFPAAPVFALPNLDRLHAPAAPTTVIDPRMPQAPQQIAETLVWHLGEGAQEVRIRLNPEDLGPLDVSLKLDGDKVAVRFDMADASVRDVVQSSLPNLASLLAARGLMLDQAQVFSQNRGQGSLPQVPWSSGEAMQDTAPEPRRVTMRRGLVDDYV